MSWLGLAPGSSDVAAMAPPQHLRSIPKHLCSTKMAAIPIPTDQSGPQRVGNELANLNLGDLPPEQKRVGSNWFAVFNPDLPRVLDVKLLHTLLHDSVVCCVCF